VRELLATRIDTFEKLELIVALHAGPRATMSLADLAAAMKVSQEVVREAALGLRASALVELTRDVVQLLPPTSREYAAVEDLVRVYHEDRLTVVKTLGEIAMQRIRNMASRAFADAFVLRKRTKDDGDG
jgi:DNA-binding GntR family transcriptional regulator